MTDEVDKPAPVGMTDLALSTKLAQLEAKVAGTVDADVKAILSGILRAGEKTLAEMNALKTRLEAADRATTQAVESAAKKVKRTDLMAAAKAAGAVDASEALRFVELGDVTVNDAGETNAATLVTALKITKPHLFSKISTSAAAAAPAATDPAKKSVLAMTKEEYAAARAAVIKR
jgi:hypothetical protein